MKRFNNISELKDFLMEKFEKYWPDLTPGTAFHLGIFEFGCIYWQLVFIFDKEGKRVEIRYSESTYYNNDVDKHTEFSGVCLDGDINATTVWSTVADDVVQKIREIVEKKNERI